MCSRHIKGICLQLSDFVPRMGVYTPYLAGGLCRPASLSFRGHLHAYTYTFPHEPPPEGVHLGRIAGTMQMHQPPYRVGLP